MWVVVVHGKREDEAAAFVHALVWLDGEGKVLDVVWVWEGSFHRAAEGKFS